jgi:hypothetical protein
LPSEKMARYGNKAKPLVRSANGFAVSMPSGPECPRFKAGRFLRPAA